MLNYLSIAMDRSSVRSYDANGFMHISTSHISKANVCPYLGKEIPNAELLGLKSDRIYQLLRDPDELEKAAPSLNNLQLLIKHKPVSPTDQKKDLIVGSTGTDADWSEPYLDNSLVVWDQDAIDGIESDTQKELSAGYYYTADMTPGVYDGVAYDGVMRDLRFNHVALIVEGRAGNDVVVGDSMENITMTRKILLSRKAAMAKGAIAVCLQPRLAQDAKLDLIPLLNGVTHENWKDSKAKIVAGLKKLSVAMFTSKPAMDAGVQDIVKLLDSLDGEQLGDKPEDGVVKDAVDDPDNTDPAAPATSPDPAAAPAASPDPEASAPQSPVAAITALLQGKISDEDLEQVLQLIGGSSSAADEPLEGSDALTPTAAAGAATFPAKPAIIQPSKEKQVDKAAMDQAIQKAKNETKLEVTKQLRDIAEAEKIVKPYIGEVMAQDSAEAVYRLALDHYEIDLEGVHPSAYKTMVKMLPVPGEEKPRASGKLVMAHDSKNAAGVSFKDRYPTASKVRQLG